MSKRRSFKMAKKYPFKVDDREFHGKRVLVTGGTKGLGASMAQRFLLGGAKVAVTARSPSANDQGDVLFIAADISNVAGTQAVADRIQREWGGVDILVDNVGGSDGFGGGFDTLTDEFWQKILDLNLMSALRLDRAFVPGMQARGFGIVIHIGTMWHRLPQTDAAMAYSAAKAALFSYSKSLAKAVGPQGVRVNMISPGFIETEAAQVVFEQISKANGISEAAARQQIIDRSGGIPVGRPGRPEEIAEVAALLASERGAFISGVDYLVDGGALPAI